MNSWKDCPNLFANGKFKVKSNSLEPSNKTHEISGVDKDGFWSGGQHTEFFSCTLIARKIEDMSFVDLQKVPSYIRWDATSATMIETLNGRSETNFIELKDALYLLSIGVYPGPQSHFGKDVIDIKTL